MKAMAASIEAKVDELLVVLDRDIEHLQFSLSQLNELRRFVVKRDDASLRELLETIRSEADSYRSNESLRQSLRQELSNALGYSFEQLTLSRLETLLSDSRKADVSEKKAELRSLAAKLQREHLGTSLLLRDCSRFNRVLLQSVFELGGSGKVTYNSQGSTRRQTDTNFLNMQF